MKRRRSIQLETHRKGQVLVFSAVSLTALLAIVALGIDLGMLYTARVEAQRSADAIALAGASAFLGNAPGDYVSDAKLRAKEYAGRNVVRNDLLDTVTVAETTYHWESSEVIVDVILDSMKVRAWVRKGGLGLWFAPFVGENFGTVGAVAAAEAASAGASSCMVPFAIPVDPRARMELGQRMILKSADSSIVGGADPYFAPFSMPEDPTVAAYCPRATGYTEEAWGNRDVCMSCDPHNGRFPGEGYGGWHQSTAINEWLAGDDNPNGNYYPADGYAENVCGNNCSRVDAGSDQTIITGDMDGPTSWGVNVRLALDPDVWWNENNNQVYRGNTILDDYEASPRIVKVPTFDPATDMTHSSDRTFTITGFAYFFLEPGPQHGFYDPADQLEITGRFLFYAPGDAGGNSTYSRVLRLVE